MILYSDMLQKSLNTAILIMASTTGVLRVMLATNDLPLKQLYCVALVSGAIEQSLAAAAAPEG
jgi:hypothetical protein